MSDFIGYFTSRGINSPDSYHAITPVRVDICPPIVSVEEKHSQQKNLNFFFSYLAWKETKLVLLSLAMVTFKKLMESAVPESTKKSLKYAVNEQTFNI